VVTRAGVLFATLAFLALTGGEASASNSVTVALTVGTTTPQAGDSLAATAWTKHFVPGYVIVIRVTDADGASQVETCKRAVCAGSWTEPDAGTASFQAFVRTKVHGGKIVGRSAVLAITWKAAPPPPPPPPPPAPPPAALAGHYCGLSNEGKSICFDVTPAAAPQVVQKLVTESIVTCGDGSEWIWTLPSYNPVSIQTPGLTYTYSFSGPRLNPPAGVSNLNLNYAITGTFDTAGNISGTIQLIHASWDENGTHYDCAGDQRTWTARLGA
jgi:hypothetical protein